MPERLIDITFDEAMSRLAMRKEALDRGIVPRIQSSLLAKTHLFSRGGEELVKQANSLSQMWQSAKDHWNSQTPELKQNLIMGGGGALLGGLTTHFGTPKRRRSLDRTMQGALAGGVIGGGLSRADHISGLGIGKRVKGLGTEAYRFAADSEPWRQYLRGDLERTQQEAQTLQNAASADPRSFSGQVGVGTAVGTAALQHTRSQVAGRRAAEGIRRELLKLNPNTGKLMANLGAASDKMTAQELVGLHEALFGGDMTMNDRLRFMLRAKNKNSDAYKAISRQLSGGGLRSWLPGGWLKKKNWTLNPLHRGDERHVRDVLRSIDPERAKRILGDSTRRGPLTTTRGLTAPAIAGTVGGYVARRYADFHAADDFRKALEIAERNGDQQQIAALKEVISKRWGDPSQLNNYAPVDGIIWGDASEKVRSTLEPIQRRALEYFGL